MTSSKTTHNKETPQISSFSGFSPATFTFLKELKENNNREWFEAHRVQFTKDLQIPFQTLVVALIPAMLEIDPQFEIKEPKKMISRIYRDLRFSKDKSPYRPNMWLSFHRFTKDWKEDPTFFFEVMPDQYHYGMGFSNPSKKFLNMLRESIETNPQEVLQMNQLLDPYSAFKLMGTEYKRLLVPQVKISPELMHWYQKKGEIYVMAAFPIDNIVSSPDLCSKIAIDFKSIIPLYNFFWSLKLLEI